MWGEWNTFGDISVQKIVFLYKLNFKKDQMKIVNLAMILGCPGCVYKFKHEWWSKKDR